MTAESEECDHARDGCQEEYDEACEFLVEECGYDQEEAEELLDEEDFEGLDDDANVFEDDAGDLSSLDDAEVVRDELPTPVLVAFKKAWNGYRAGRASIDEGAEGAVEETRRYAGIINSIRQGIGQEPMEFEAKDGFEGGRVTPEEAGVGEFETDAETTQATLGGKVTVYDPTEDLS